MDPRHTAPQSLQELIGDQLKATYRLLELNQAISAHLGQVGQLDTTGSKVSTRSGTPQVQDSFATHAAFGKWLLRQELQRERDLIRVDSEDSCSFRLPHAIRNTPPKSTPLSQSEDSNARKGSRDDPIELKDSVEDRDEEDHVIETCKGDLLEPLLGAVAHQTSPSLVPSPSPCNGPPLPKRRKQHGHIGHKPLAKKGDKKPKKHEYSVEDLYSETGWAQKIAKSNQFQNATLIVILANTIWMAVDTDFNKAAILCEAALIFQIVDNLFCTYFVFEITMRFCAFKTKIFAFSDFWFLGDSCLVLLMVWETWIQVLLYKLTGGDTGGGGRSASVLRIFRAFRLLRISRMSRLLRSMPELFILVKSIGAAMRCMFVTLIMLMIVIYVFSIMFTQLLSTTEVGKDRFETVPQSINFMLTQVLCGFDSEVIMLLLNEGFVYYALWLLYVLIGSLSIMNVLIGILCEVVSGTADDEKERAVRSDVEFQIIKTGIDGQREVIGKQEMMLTLESHIVTEKLVELGVDVVALLDFVHFFEESMEMSLPDFVELVVQFRGAKNTTVRDIVDLRKFISLEIAIIEGNLHSSVRDHSSIEGPARSK